MENTGKKPRRLLIQVSLMTVVIFAATLLYMVISDYLITKRSYLKAKQEMIDRDLENMEKNLDDDNNEWLLPFIMENADELLKGLSAEEKEVRNSERYAELSAQFYMGGVIDPEELSKAEKMLFAHSSLSISVYILNAVNEVGYENVCLMDFVDENEAFYYLDSNSVDVVNGLLDETQTHDETPGSDMLHKISYPASKHSAVKEILKDKASGIKKTYYEVYHDPDNDKNYYIGYMPYVKNGKVICYFCLKYDWSDFHSELIGHLEKSVLIGLSVLLVLNFLLLIYLYTKAIKPAQKVKDGVQAYMEDKDSAAVCEKMKTIRTRNEIGILAGSFSDLAMEIDRYTNDVMKLTDEKARISTELDLATTIQADMLPSTFPAFPDREEFDLYASMTPAKEVGGDFYDFFLIDDDHLGMVIADVSGKGIPAAMFMMFCKNVVANNAKLGNSPANALNNANKTICANNSKNMFVTVWLGILEISTGHLTAANAGHEYPMLKHGDSFTLFKDKHGMPVGFMDIITYQEYELDLKPGDKLFVYTDGVPEATAEDKEMFGTDRTLEVLNKNPDATPQQMLENVKEGVDAFVKDAEQFDDLTMLAIEYKGKKLKKL